MAPCLDFIAYDRPEIERVVPFHLPLFLAVYCMQKNLSEVVERKLTRLREVISEKNTPQRYDMHRLTMLFYLGVQLQAQLHESADLPLLPSELMIDFNQWIRSLNDELGLDPEEDAELN